MDLTSLNAITPIDGRYSEKTESLKQYFSEAALIKYRLLVEVEYFIAICNLPLPQLKEFPAKKHQLLRKLYTDFNNEDAKKIKDIEGVTNHDVKAVEYFIKEEFDKLGLEDFKEFIHFGLTSQDINNTAIPLSIKEAMERNYLPHLKKILKDMETIVGKKIDNLIFKELDLKNYNKLEYGL